MYLYRDANKKLNYVFKCAKPKKKKNKEEIVLPRQENYK